MSEHDEFDARLKAVCARRDWKASDEGVEVPLDGGRRQGVALNPYQHAGAAYVRLYSVIGSTRRIDPLRLVDALRMNFGLPVGCLAVHGEDLVIVETLRVAEADEVEIEMTLAYLAETGDQYERTMFGPDEH